MATLRGKKDNGMFVHSLCRDQLKFSYCAYQIGYFDATIGMDDARLISNLLQTLALPTESILLALYPIDEDRWRDLVSSNWTTVLEKRFVRTHWLGKPKQVHWVIGYPHNFDKLAEVLRFAWNISGNETLLAVIADKDDFRQLERDYVDDLETHTANEEALIKHYPTIISRGHDGLVLRVFSKRLAIDDLLAVLNRLSPDKVRVREDLL